MRQPLTHWRTTSADQTKALGERLAASLPTRKDAATIVYLIGDLGAGKTTFAQGFVKGCGVADTVRSPTYALLEPYEAEGFTVLHLDLYRLRDPSDLEPLGLRDWAGPGHLWLVEWPQKGGSKLPPADVRIVLGIADGAHEITATALSAFGRSWLCGTNTA